MKLGCDYTGLSCNMDSSTSWKEAADAFHRTDMNSIVVDFPSSGFATLFVVDDSYSNLLGWSISLLQNQECVQQTGVRRKTAVQLGLLRMLMLKES